MGTKSIVAKPSIALVHGAFADGPHWRHIIPKLCEAGHRVMAAQNPLTSLADDIATTRKLAEWMGGPTLPRPPSHRGDIPVASRHRIAQTKRFWCDSASAGSVELPRIQTHHRSVLLPSAVSTDEHR